MQSFVVDYYSKIELRYENCLFKGKYLSCGYRFKG